MALTISEDELVKTLSLRSISEHGTRYEVEYGGFLHERFPNYEKYWKYFVVPLTTIIENAESGRPIRIPFRNDVSDQMIDICALHSSVFLNLCYSRLHLQNPNAPSSFEDFYVNLVAACDVAETFLFKVYLLILASTGEEDENLKPLDSDDFVRRSQEWFEVEYHKNLENFKKIGYFKSLYLRHDVLSVLTNYFGGDQNWSDYKKHTQFLRHYRNTITHSAQLPFVQEVLIGRGGNPENKYVPKIKTIGKYKTWSKFSDALSSYEQLRKDFVNMEEQMNSNIREVEKQINGLWEKPICDLYRLLYEDANEYLLGEFNIIFSIG